MPTRHILFLVGSAAKRCDCLLWPGGPARMSCPRSAPRSSTRRLAAPSRPWKIPMPDEPFLREKEREAIQAGTLPSDDRRHVGRTWIWRGVRVALCGEPPRRDRVASAAEFESRTRPRRYETRITSIPLLSGLGSRATQSGQLTRAAARSMGFVRADDATSAFRSHCAWSVRTGADSTITFPPSPAPQAPGQDRACQGTASYGIAPGDPDSHVTAGKIGGTHGTRVPAATSRGTGVAGGRDLIITSSFPGSPMAKSRTESPRRREVVSSHPRWP